MSGEEALEEAKADPDLWKLILSQEEEQHSHPLHCPG